MKELSGQFTIEKTISKEEHEKVIRDYFKGQGMHPDDVELVVGAWKEDPSLFEEDFDPRSSHTRAPPLTDRDSLTQAAALSYPKATAILDLINMGLLSEQEYTVLSQKISDQIPTAVRWNTLMKMAVAKAQNNVLDQIKKGDLSGLKNLPLTSEAAVLASIVKNYEFSAETLKKLSGDFSDFNHFVTSLLRDQVIKPAFGKTLNSVFEGLLSENIQEETFETVWAEMRPVFFKNPDLIASLKKTGDAPYKPYPVYAAIEPVTFREFVFLKTLQLNPSESKNYGIGHFATMWPFAMYLVREVNGALDANRSRSDVLDRLSTITQSILPVIQIEVTEKYKKITEREKPYEKPEIKLADVFSELDLYDLFDLFWKKNDILRKENKPVLTFESFMSQATGQAFDWGTAKKTFGEFQDALKKQAASADKNHKDIVDAIREIESVTVGDSVRWAASQKELEAAKAILQLKKDGKYSDYSLKAAYKKLKEEAKNAKLRQAAADMELWKQFDEVDKQLQKLDVMFNTAVDSLHRELYPGAQKREEDTRAGWQWKGQGWWRTLTMVGSTAAIFLSLVFSMPAWVTFLAMGTLATAIVTVPKGLGIISFYKERIIKPLFSLEGFWGMDWKFLGVRGWVYYTAAAATMIGLGIAVIAGAVSFLPASLGLGVFFIVSAFTVLPVLFGKAPFDEKVFWGSISGISTGYVFGLLTQKLFTSWALVIVGAPTVGFWITLVLMFLTFPATLVSVYHIAVTLRSHANLSGYSRFLPVAGFAVSALLYLTGFLALPTFLFALAMSAAMITFVPSVDTELWSKTAQSMTGVRSVIDPSRMRPAKKWIPAHYKSWYEEFRDVEENYAPILPNGETSGIYIKRLVNRLHALYLLSEKEKDQWIGALEGEKNAVFVQPESQKAQEILYTTFFTMSQKKNPSEVLSRLQATSTHVMAAGELYTHTWDNSAAFESFNEGHVYVDGKLVRSPSSLLGHMADNFKPEWSNLMERLKGSGVSEELVEKLREAYAATDFNELISQYSASDQTVVKESTVRWLNEMRPSNASVMDSLAQDQLEYHLFASHDMGDPEYQDGVRAAAANYASLDEAYEKLSERQIEGKELSPQSARFLARYLVYKDLIKGQLRHIFMDLNLGWTGYGNVKKPSDQVNVFLEPLNKVKTKSGVDPRALRVVEDLLAGLGEVKPGSVISLLRWRGIHDRNIKTLLKDILPAPGTDADYDALREALLKPVEMATPVRKFVDALITVRVRTDVEDGMKDRIDAILDSLDSVQYDDPADRSLSSRDVMVKTFLEWHK
ncbi:MAG TPA: hypothetical protein VD883_02445, partial [Candidatus Omnitrophota bacterium]|nr:hypothetical protein [Candidatus Omnitrophota bacterium]